MKPTFHPNCRCRIRQVLPPEIQATARKAARNAEGKHITIPQDMSYDEWERRFGTKAGTLKLKRLPKLVSDSESR